METETQLPLTEVTFLILASLGHGSRHGYAIMKDVRHLSNERVTLSTGTLYGALKRLLELGWIERVEDAHAGQSGRVRKAYALTAEGRAMLNAEIVRMNSLVAAAQLRTAGENSS